MGCAWQFVECGPPPFLLLGRGGGTTKRWNSFGRIPSFLSLKSRFCIGVRVFSLLSFCGYNHHRWFWFLFHRVLLFLCFWLHRKRTDFAVQYKYRAVVLRGKTNVHTRKTEHQPSFPAQYASTKMVTPTSIPTYQPPQNIHVVVRPPRSATPSSARSTAASWRSSLACFRAAFTRWEFRLRRRRRWPRW